MAETRVYGVPGWVGVAPGQVDGMLGSLTADVVEADTPVRVGYLRALLWVVGDGAAPVTGRVGQPVTEVVAEVEWWSALAAVRPGTTYLAPLREISAEVGVAYRAPGVVGVEVAHPVWVVLTWLLGLQEPDGPHGLPGWMYGGPTPSARELFEKATVVEAEHGARRAPGHWAAVYQRAERDEVRYRRMAARMREIEDRAAGAGR